MAGQDLLLLAEGQTPVSYGIRNDFVLVLLRAVLYIAGQVPVEQVLVGADQEGAGTAGRVQYSHGGNLLRGFSFQELADSALDDVIHDVGRCVVDASSLLDFRLELNLYLARRGNPDNLPEKLLVDLPKNVRGNMRKGVGAVGIVEILQDWPEPRIIDSNGRRQCVRLFVALLFLMKMKETRVIATVSQLEEVA